MNFREELKNRKIIADKLPVAGEPDSPSMKYYTTLKEEEIEPLMHTKKTGCAGMQLNITTHNGSPCRYLSKGKIKFTSLEEAIRNEEIQEKEIFTEMYDKMSAINQAYFTDGSFIGIPSNYENENMISILNTGDSDFNSRNIYKMGAESSVKILENFIITGESNISHGTVIRMGENSSLDYYFLEDVKNSKVSYVERTFIMPRYSRLRIHHLSIPGSKNITRFRVIQEGEFAESYYYGATLGKRNEHQDLEVYTHHLAPHGKNDTSFKGILGGNSSIIFRGFIKIEEKALNTDSFLLANLLLLSKEARGNALPVLEIYNGEVKAKHGETVSNISDEELIYLESRGMEPKKAKKLIIEGFVNPIISPLPPEISERYLDIVEDVVDNA